MGRVKYVFSGVAWTILSNVVSILYGIISVPFLINYFGKEEYGLIGLAISINAYISLIDLGLNNTNVKYFSEFSAKKETGKIQELFSLSYYIYLLIGILNTIVLIGVSFFTSTFFTVTPEQEHILRNLIWILALNATFSWVSVCFDEYLRSEELVGWIKKRYTLLKVLQFVVLLATILFKWSIEIYFFAYTFAMTVILPLTIFKVKIINPSLSLKPKFYKEMLKAVFPYVISVFSFSIFQFLALNFRPLILGGMVGPAAVAEYNVLNAVVLVPGLITGSFMQVLLPIITKMSVGDEQSQVEEVMIRGTKYLNLLISIIVFALVLTASEVLELYVGPDYTHLSLWLIIWLMTALLGHRNVMTALVFTQDKLKSVAIMGAVAMIVAFVAFYFLTPIYGVGGVIIGYLLHELVHTLFYYIYFLPKQCHLNTINVFKKAVVLTWLLFGLLVCFLYWMSSFLSEQLLVRTFIKLGVFVVLSVIVAVVVLDKQDVQLIRSVLPFHKKVHS